MPFRSDLVPEPGRDVVRAAILAHGVRFAESVDKRGNVLDWGLDLREVLYRPAAARAIASLLWETIRAWQPDAVGGMTLSAEQLTAALLRAALDDGRELDGFSVRRERKGYGMRRRIEGVAPSSGARVVVVDDLVDSGHAMGEVARLVAQCGATVAGYASVVDFRNPASAVRLGERAPRAALFDLAELGLVQAADVPWHAPVRVASDLNLGGYTAPQSTPLVDAQGLVAAGDTGIVRAWDPRGAERWRYDAGAGEHGVRTVIEGVREAVLFGGYDGWVTSLQRASGAQLWKQRLGDFIGASLAVDREAGRLFVAANREGRTCEFTCLHLASGDVAWRVPAPAWSYVRPALVGHDGVVFAANDGRVRCLDRASGALRWTVDVGAPVKGWVVATEGACCFGAFDGWLWALSDADGRTLWRRRLADWLLVHPAVAGDLVLVGGRTHLGAFDRHDGTLRWVRRSGRVTGVAVTPDGRWAFGGNDEGDFFCVEVQSGVYRWRYRAPAAFRATPGVGADRCVVPSYDGALYAFSTDPAA